MTLDDAKELISNRFLGQAGIHGVGIRRAEGAVSLYVENDADEKLISSVLPDIKQQITPHQVVLVPAPKPGLMPS